MSTALVPYEDKQISFVFSLVEDDIELVDRESVKRYLPDILGRALARSWIDQDYKRALMFDVKSTLAKGGVTVPDEYECVFETTTGQRAKIVVYEKARNNFKIRVCGLSLTMVASR